VERLRAGIAALQAKGERITAESLKRITRELEPGFAGLSFEVIRRNSHAYELYRVSADAFKTPSTGDLKPSRRSRRRARVSGRLARSGYNPLQRFDKRDLTRRIRALQAELQAEQLRHAALAQERQTLLARILRLETELILRQTGSLADE
jgi:hypothetical protein